MNPKRVTSLILLFSMFILFNINCGKDKDEPALPTFTGITGTVSLLPGVSANLSNARVAVYTSLDDLVNDSFLMQTALTGNSPSWTFEIGPLNPGSYYLDVWLDVNNDSQVTIGDVWGAYSTGTGGNPSPIQVLQDQTTNISFTIGPVTSPAKQKEM